MLFIAHDLTVVSYFCDKIGVMYGGMILEEAKSLELINNRLHPYTKHLYSSMPNIQKEFSPDNSLNIGEIQNPSIMPKGCPYYRRCPIHKEICGIEKPILREITKEHFVACHMI